MRISCVEPLKECCHYLEGANDKIYIHCNRNLLKYFQRINVLSQRKTWWVVILSWYKIDIKYLEDNQNQVDRPSRRSDYEIGHQWTMTRLLATLAEITITESYGDLLLESMAAQENDHWVSQIPLNLRDISNADGNQWRSINGPLTCERMIYGPIALQNRVTSHYHDKT